MPVLHKYNESYHKSGYYVKVNWSAPHPYPLQTPSITEDIYRELGFEPEDDVPNELTSRLFNAGLHWTEGSGPGDPQEQTEIDSITDAELPDLTQDQLDRVKELLENAETDIAEVETKPGAVNELKSELNQVRPAGDTRGTESQSETIPTRTVSMLRDLVDTELDKETASQIRSEAVDREAFDRTLDQFIRSLLITPREFRVNEHGDPTFRFETGPVLWELADCRVKNLNFEWAVTINPHTNHAFGVRIDSNELVRLVFNESSLSGQQAVNLITVIPCLLWVISSVPDYRLSSTWHVEGAKNDLAPSEYNQLVAQTATTLQTLQSEIEPQSGIIIDHPDREFARIRSLERCILCAPVASLPDDASRGSKVTFDVEHRYDTLYATDVTLIEEENPIWPNKSDLEKEIKNRLSKEFETVEIADQSCPVQNRQNNLTVRIQEQLSDSETDILNISTSYSIDTVESQEQFCIEFSLEKNNGLKSVDVTTDIELSWTIKGSIYQLISESLPIIATALEHKNINPGSYDDSLVINIQQQ